MATAQTPSLTMHTMKCSNCGASLKFAPGTKSLKCEFCNTMNEINTGKSATVVEEIDFEKFLSEHNVAADEKHEVVEVKCSACGASSVLQPNITSDNCPFCDNALVIKNGTTSSIIRPKYLLPFAIDKKVAFDDFGKWIKGLWFAPNNLKNKATNIEKLNGVYIPYWTYDADTTSAYTGMRGMDYQVEETYTTTEDGEEVTRTRTVTHTDWTPTAGTVDVNFDDVLVLASKSLPQQYTYALEPWDIKELTDYDDGFLAGFKTEVYQVDVKTGFNVAKNIMGSSINNAIAADIGGDHQRINSVNTAYSDITFKHILLPIWLSAYTYNNKVYHFMVNGRTGQVKGERPYSWIKITALIIFIAAIVGVIVMLANK